MRFWIIISSMLLALFCQIDGEAGQAKVIPVVHHEEFHYDCKFDIQMNTYNYKITFVKVGHAYFVTNNRTQLDFSNSTTNQDNTCFKNVPANVTTISLPQCNATKVYMFLQNQTYFGGLNFNVYELSCLVRGKGVLYNLSQTVAEKEKNGTLDIPENPDLQLSMAVSTTSGSSTAPFEIGQELQLKVIDNSTNKNVLRISKCDAYDQDDSGLKITLISDGTTQETQIVPTNPINVTTPGEASFHFFAFRFTRSNTVTIVCTIMAYPNNPYPTTVTTAATATTTVGGNGRRKRSADSRETIEKAKSAETSTRNRRKRSADSRANIERSKSLQTTFTVVSDTQASSQVKAAVNAIFVAVCTVIASMRMG